MFYILHYLHILGGLESFSATYPHLCVSSSCSGVKAHSPLGISVSASLPSISFSNKRPQVQRLHTPSENSGNHFGPPMEILPHLVLGSAKDSSNLIELRKMGVTAVLNVSHNCPNHFESLLEYKSIAVEDSYQADLLSKMEAAIDFIGTYYIWFTCWNSVYVIMHGIFVLHVRAFEQLNINYQCHSQSDSVKAKNGCVFVHCHAGISRSATISISYIMKTMNVGLTRAYDFVKQKRPCISPNLNFMGQLLEFEKKLNEKRDSETMEHQSLCDSYTPHSDVLMPLPCKSSITEHTLSCGGTSRLESSHVPVHWTTSPIDEGSHLFCLSTSLPSASAPSSLNFDKVDNRVRDDGIVQNHLVHSLNFTGGEQRVPPSKPNMLPLFQISPAPTYSRIDPLQQITGGEHRVPPSKPITLPLRQLHHPHLSISTDSQAYRLKQQSSAWQGSISLPTTPDTNHKNHVLSSSSSASMRVAPYSLPNSPCRVVAYLRSRSETCLNYQHTSELSL